MHVCWHHMGSIVSKKVARLSLKSGADNSVSFFSAGIMREFKSGAGSPPKAGGRRWSESSSSSLFEPRCSTTPRRRKPQTGSGTRRSVDSKKWIKCRTCNTFPNIMALVETICYFGTCKWQCLFQFKKFFNFMSQLFFSTLSSGEMQ